MPCEVLLKMIFLIKFQITIRVMRNLIQKIPTPFGISKGRTRQTISKVRFNFQNI